jgi:hypothetical protein
MIELLVTILVLCIIAGLFYWALGYLPIPQPFKNIVYFVLIIIFIIILLSFVFGGIPTVNLGGWHHYRN